VGHPINTKTPVRPQPGRPHGRARSGPFRGSFLWAYGPICYT